MGEEGKKSENFADIINGSPPKGALGRRQHVPHVFKPAINLDFRMTSAASERQHEVTATTAVGIFPFVRAAAALAFFLPNCLGASKYDVMKTFEFFTPHSFHHS